ncbi:MAG: hypothetical protein IJ905_09685 [Fibrobacter sp.]|nr:hypothetical protein [Fibrobacter sp.]
MQQDMLGRESFVSLLENIIIQKTNAHEGFSFAIDGKWGCGKSWILKELEQKLELKNYLVIHYNCWENEYYEEPLVAILSVIIDKLNQLQENIPDKNKKDRIQIALKFFAEVISTILTNKFGIGFNDFLESGKKAIAADKVPAISKDFDKNQSLKDALAAVRENLLQLTNVLSESKDVFENVIIVVDELDRCLPEYAIKVMQRLHHICFDTTSDKYMFIQLAAINKSELLGSIAKTFGREFNLKQKYTAADTKPGSIVYENFDECQIQFGNYYFKKFFQLIIPVSNGEKIERPLSLLDGFENNFDSTDVTGKEYVEKFFTDVLAFFPMRTKLELVHLVKTAHEITSMDESLDKNLKYNTLCIELIDCLCKAVLKKELPIIRLQTNDNSSKKIYLQIPSFSNVEGISNSRLPLKIHLFRKNGFSFAFTT